MSKETNVKYQERLNRINTAINLGIPDRVPFMPRVTGFYAYGYDLNYYLLMKDLRNAEPGIRQFLRDYEPDMACPIVTYNMDLVEMLGASYIKTPGPQSGLPLDAPFQFIDHTYMEEDEFDEFLIDPTHFILTKLMPRKNRNLAGLEKIYLREIYEHMANMELSVFADPEVKQALYTLVRAGEFALESKKQLAYLSNIYKEEGVPARGGMMLAPFDIFADSIRGLIQATIDILEMPEKTLEVVNRIADFTIARQIPLIQARGDKTIFMPLHAGMDMFMSAANYEKFYWPTLRRVIDALVEIDVTPMLMCQGTYNNRLEILSDVPKGKVVYLFEGIDMKKAKETVGKVACIAGNLPSQLLCFGKKEQVIDETKRLLDICAPGGGYIMDASLMLENPKHENMRVWRETLDLYGKY